MSDHRVWHVIYSVKRTEPLSTLWIQGNCYVVIWAFVSVVKLQERDKVDQDTKFALALLEHRAKGGGT